MSSPIRAVLFDVGGVLVRTRVSEIREMGRATQGVTLISVDQGMRLSGVQRVVEADSDDDPVADAEAAVPDAGAPGPGEGGEGPAGA